MLAELRLLSIPSKALWVLMMGAASVATVATAVLVGHTIECLRDPATFGTIPEWVFGATLWAFVGWSVLTLVAAFAESRPPRGFYLISGRLMAGAMFAFAMCLAALID